MARDLLSLRLDALYLDIETVRYAVDLAERRSAFLKKAQAAISPCRGKLRAVESRLQGLVTSMDDEPEISRLLNQATVDLEKQLRETPALLAELISSVAGTVDALRDAMATTVSLEDRLPVLQSSLNRRCDELQRKLATLQQSVQSTGGRDRASQWIEYQQLLDDVARPLFMEYVDFLGGLTVRDTGLDDRVCEMTDSLLTRYKAVTPRRSLNLPARQAALGSALDSVVLLGFPEWSVWGIPLVGHEVGLAYAKDEYDDELFALIRKFMPEELPAPTSGDSAPRTEEHLMQFFADVFATYTLGLSYACAALLLRLSPRHDEQGRLNRPRDIDRARAIMTTLEATHDSALAGGGSFSDAVGTLHEIWEAGIRAYADPARAGEAIEGAHGSRDQADWLDDFTKEAVELLRAQRYTIRAYDHERWRGSNTWVDALKDKKKASPPWTPFDETVPDVLTAAWRLRLVEGVEPVELASDVKERWSTGRKGG